MFGPDDAVGCKHCSLRADGFDGINIHLKHRDVTIIAVSRTPYAKLASFGKTIMGLCFIRTRAMHAETTG
jgi:predicted dithiol-disulfide oxidoreductase (DUF899 family)